MKNEILEEIRRSRKEVEDEEGGVLKNVFDRMKKKTAESPRKRYSGKTRFNVPSRAVRRSR